MLKKILIGLAILLLLGIGGIYLVLPPINVPIAIFQGGVQADESLLTQRISLPDGFRFNVFATDLPGARMMKITAQGDLLVTTPSTGEVHLLFKDINHDGAADGRKLILSGLEKPHGVELFQGWLYIAEINAVGRIRFDASTREATGTYEQIVTNLPTEGRHWTRTVHAGPDGWLYISIGSSCNACIETDPLRATIIRVRPDGKDQEIYASGLRNSVDFDWSPSDGALYATENGRDLLGDDFPPEELNRIESGGFYGWPYINGFGDPDPEYQTDNEEILTNAIQPVHGLRPHNAPLGIHFLHTGHYRHDALVALHGSWNRRDKDGYKVVRLHWSAEGKITESDFMTGFLDNDDVIGRPAGIAESPSGEIFISDDFSGSIYRVVQTGQE
jgi:glucose/arabinose dehydrogenase